MQPRVDISGMPETLADLSQPRTPKQAQRNVPFPEASTWESDVEIVAKLADFDERLGQAEKQIEEKDLHISLLEDMIATRDKTILELRAEISPAMEVKRELVRSREELDDGAAEADLPRKRVCGAATDADDIIAKLAKSLNAALIEKPPPTEADWAAKFGAETKDVDERQKMLEEAKNNGFLALSSMGQEFHRSAEGQGAEYKALKKNAEKSLFRRKWAATTYDAYVQVKSRCQTWLEVDEKKGTYMPLARLIKAEGGRNDDTAIQAALKHAQKCIAMGGRFIKYNSMTERWDFLRFEHHVSEIFQQKWQMYEEWKSVGGGGKSDGGGVAIAGARAPANIKDDAGPGATGSDQGAKLGSSGAGAAIVGKKTGGKNKAREQGEVIDKPGGKKPPRERGEVEKAVAKALVVKTLHQKATSKATSVLASMSDANWDFASDDMKNSLKQNLENAMKCMEAAMTPFARVFMTTEVAKIKRETDATTLMAQCLQIESALESCVQDVISEAWLGHRQQTAPCMCKNIYIYIYIYTM
jgi:hypothetical protein